MLKQQQQSYMMFKQLRGHVMLIHPFTSYENVSSRCFRRMIPHCLPSAYGEAPPVGGRGYSQCLVWGLQPQDVRATRHDWCPAKLRAPPTYSLLLPQPVCL